MFIISSKKFVNEIFVCCIRYFQMFYIEFSKQSISRLLDIFYYIITWDNNKDFPSENLIIIKYVLFKNNNVK